MLLIEQSETFGGNHTWSFFDSDVPAELRWVLEGIRSVRWPAHDVRFPRRSRTIPVGYNSIRSADLDRAVRATLRADQYRLGASIQTLGPSSVLLDGEAIRADAVVDARGPVEMPGLDLAWQKFVGRYYTFAKPHGLNQPVIMDATVEQLDGYRFVYQLPVSSNELLIEDTYYSASPILDREAIQNRIEVVAAKVGDGPRETVEEESGVLPIVLGGNIERLWEGERIPRLGLRGGFFHPTTSYSLPDAVANAALFAQQSELGSGSLHDLFHRRSRQLWDDRSFFRLLNRMLFRAAEPDQAYRVLEHFYRLPPALIARFYAAHLSGLDKIRILSGKPPVPLGRAVSTILGVSS